MKTFFMSLLVLSILGVAGTYYWKTFHPESGKHVSSSVDGTDRDAMRRNPGARSRLPSRRQENFFSVAVLSSVLSMLGTLLSIWFAYRADRRAIRATNGQ